MSDLLHDRVVLITGASSGIGAAAARVFSQEGATVVLAARREDRLASLVAELKDKGARAAYVVCDVTVAEDAARAVDFTVDTYGKLDSAFNNAGLGGDRTPSTSWVTTSTTRSWTPTCAASGTASATR